jgi:GntR family transcriptional regulator, transcriptional repressor for pyruvate dehydrogenase complex
MAGEQPTAPGTTAKRSRVRPQRIAETIAAELRRRILGREVYALPAQDELVEEFGVSHPSVREAIRILETEGLVTVRRGNVGGLEIHRPDETSAAYHLGLALQGGRVTLRDLADGLQLLEPLCAGACARRDDRNDVVVPALLENVAESGELVGSGVEFTHTSRAFHDLLVAFTPSVTVRYVVRSLVALWSTQEEAWARSRTERGEYPSELEADEVVRTHRRIVDKIAAGRPADAERVARAHLAATQARVLADDDGGIVDAALARARGAEHPINAGRL